MLRVLHMLQRLFGVKATVVMPTVTPLMKVNRTKSYGADVILYGDVYDDACNYALNLAEERRIYIYSSI